MNLDKEILRVGSPCVLTICQIADLMELAPGSSLVRFGKQNSCPISAVNKREHVMYDACQSSQVAKYGEFFYQWPWDHFATLTFTKSGSLPHSIATWNWFIDRLGRITRGRVSWVRGDEVRWSGCGKPQIPLHFHSLLLFQHPPGPQTVAELWKTQVGDAQVKQYDPAKGAAWYTSELICYPTGDPI